MKSLNIGVVAYGIDRTMVFVRVPNERGRWMLVDRSVAEVDCPHCKAVAGEPCRRAWPEWGRVSRPAPSPEEIRYHVAVHVSRKREWAKARGHRHPSRDAPPHKIRLRPEDIYDVRANADDLEA